MLMLGILCDSNVVFSNCIYISFFHFCLVNLGFINKYDYTAPMKYHTLNKQISCTYKKKRLRSNEAEKEEKVEDVEPEDSR